MPTPLPVHELPVAEARAFLARHREGDYELVDVRQPQEYDQAHIPGARLLPLPELQRLLESGQPLPLDATRPVIFYCHAGNRSRMAGRMAGMSGRFAGPIHSLAGGMAGWTGMSLPEPPRLQQIPLDQGLQAMLLAALDLEKAAFVLYAVLEEESRRVGSCQLPDKLPTHLVDMELAHARQVYRILAQHWPDGPAPDFDELFAQAGGEVLEGGRRLEELTPWVAAALRQDGGCAGVAELGLEVEMAAQDLYKAVAHAAQAAGQDEAAAIFLDLANQEKKHAAFLLDKLERLAA